MRLTALVECPDHVCCRYRLSAFRFHLQAAGHELALETMPRGLLSRLQLFHRLRGQTVIVQRKLLPFWELTWLRRCVGRLLFDFDDAIFLRDSYAKKGLHHAGRLRRFAAMVRACDAVVAGNRFLAEQASQFAPAKKVHIVPTCVDAEKYMPRTTADSAAPARLGWIGSPSTLQGLHTIKPILEEVGRRIPGVTLALICDRSLELRHLPVVLVPWSEATEAVELAGCDIGISWVPDDLWSRGKCGLKILQYMAAGLPVVTNGAGVHPEMVRNGENGFLVETREQWVEAIGRLAIDPELRVRMGQAGRRRLEESYSVPEGARAWLAVLASLDQSSRRAS